MMKAVRRGKLWLKVFWDRLHARLTGRGRHYQEIVDYCRAVRKGLNPEPLGGHPALRRMKNAVCHADTPLQRCFAWCPWCDLELISAKCRWWLNKRERLIWIQCSRCKRRSRWDVESSGVLESMDAKPPVLPARRPQA